MFTRRGAERIARQTRDAERRPASPPAAATRARPNTFMLGAATKRLARTIYSIGNAVYDSASSILDHGSGSIRFFALNSAGQWVLGTQSAIAYNVHPGAIEANTVVQVARLDGRWVVDVASCPY